MKRNGYCVSTYTKNPAYRIDCFDDGNQLLWEVKTAPNSDAKLYGLVAALDGNGNLHVFTREADHQVLKAYSSTGDLLWRHNEDTVPGTYSKAMRVVGDTLMLVRFDKIDTENNTYYFQQFDSNGEATSTLSVDGLNYDFYLAPFQDNSCLMMVTDRGRHLELSRIGSDGTLMWKKTLSGHAENLEFKTQQKPIRIDAQGNIDLISVAASATYSPLIFPVSVTNRYLITRFDPKGNKLQEDLIGRNRYRVVSDVDPTQTLESGFAPDEFLPTEDGYIAAGVNTYDLAEDNPDHTYSPPMVVNRYRW